MGNKTLRIIGLIAIGLLVLNLFFCNRTNTPTDKEIRAKVLDSIKPQLKLAEQLKAKSDSAEIQRVILNDSIQLLNALYAESREDVITQQETISIQNEVIAKGIKRYGPPAAKQENNALTASYGAQAFDELQLTDRIMENMKVQVSALSGVVLSQDTIIKIQQWGLDEVVKNDRKTFWQKLWIFLKGVGVGAALVLVF